jgi:hypothetical protein
MVPPMLKVMPSLSNVPARPGRFSKSGPNCKWLPPTAAIPLGQLPALLGKACTSLWWSDKSISATAVDCWSMIVEGHMVLTVKKPVRVTVRFGPERARDQNVGRLRKFRQSFRTNSYVAFTTACTASDICRPRRLGAQVSRQRAHQEDARALSVYDTQY